MYNKKNKQGKREPGQKGRGFVVEEKRIGKSFFSSVKECKWLNELGQQGYRLVYKRDGRYVFEVDEGKVWYYSVEWLDCAPESERAQAYIRSRGEEGAELAATFSLWAYFCSPEPIPERAESKKRTAVHYRNVALLLFLFDAITAVLIGYHFVIRGYLEKQGVLIKAPTLKTTGTFIVDLARRLVYGGKELLYRYGKLCSHLFGDTQATLVLGILIPLAVVLSIASAFWAAEWLKNRPAKRDSAPEDPETDAPAQDASSQEEPVA